MTTQHDDRASLRWSVYSLLITLSVGAMLGRILAVDAVDMQALQRVRMQKVEEKLQREEAALKKRGLSEQELDAKLAPRKEELYRWAKLRRPFLSANDRSRWCTLRALVEDDMRVEGHSYAIDKVIQEPGWDTIDMVKHDGHLFSSKPPLFPTMMAGPYWLIHRLTGWTLGDHPYVIGRIMLVTFNVLPMILFFVLLAALVERLGTTDWSRLFVMGSAAFGTFLTTFAVTINNHLIAAVSAMVALYAVARIWFDDRRELRYFAVAGLFAAFAAANELPALSFFGLVGLGLLWKAPWRTLGAFAPAAAVVVAAFFGANWLAHGDLKPAYMHRHEGDNWYDYSYEVNGRTVDSYWRNPVGVDRGEQDRGIYTMHILVGHHGIFSLTPIWLLSALGTLMWLVAPRDARLRQFAVMVAVLTAVCLAFYLKAEPHYRNYGGLTSGLRWMFWFAPLWLVAMLPAADWLARRRFTQAVGLVLLAASVLSASYPTWNPWVHPWLMDYLAYLGVV